MLNNIAFMKFIKNIFTYLFILIFANLSAQYFPKNAQKFRAKAEKYADSLYQQLSLDEKIRQLYIVALYNNREKRDSENWNLVEKENRWSDSHVRKTTQENTSNYWMNFKENLELKWWLALMENGDCSKDFRA